MTIKEKIINYVKTENKNKLPIEDKIEYLKMIKESKDIDLNDAELNYVSEEGIIVKNIVKNIKKY